MKVILLKETPKLGRKDDIVEVKSGHAMNFLIPNGFAIMATPLLEKKTLEKKESEREASEKEIMELQTSLAEISKNPIKVSAKASEKGHLFAGIGIKEIIEAIKKETGKEIPEKILKLDKEIKEVGKREVEAKAGDKAFKLKIFIEAN